MKTIIAGSRSITDPMVVARAVAAVLESTEGFRITEIVSGAAKGVDTSGELLAPFLNVPVKRFPADWERHGKHAGYLRNIEMADYADALIAVWDGASKGTKHMIETAKQHGLQVHICIEGGE